jgi:tRNA(Ile)-lysidine synthase
MPKQVLSEVQAAFSAHLPRQGAVVIGVSGGADSLALLDAAARLIPNARQRLKVVHVHHGLRSAAADQDQRLVQRQASRLGLACWCYHSQVGQVAAKRGLTVEEAGRMVRQACLLDAAWHWKARAVLLAHHMDDQAETVLAQLLRGAGGQGLAAMRPARPFPHPTAPPKLLLVRPLLALRKRELEAYCRSRGLAWREDASNRSLRFSRNRLRLRLLPLLTREYNPQSARLLAASAASLARDDEYLSRQAEQAFRRLSRKQGSGGLGLDRGGFCRLAPALQFRVASLAWDQLDIPNKSAQHLERLVAACVTGHTGLSLPGRWSGRTTPRHLWLVPRKSAAKSSTWQLSLRRGMNVNARCPYGVDVQAAAIPKSLKSIRPREIFIDAQAWRPTWVARAYRPGDYIRPLGLSGHSQDVRKLFTSMRVPVEERRGWPLLAQGQEVLWVYQGSMSEKLKITPQTKKALKVRIFKAGAQKATNRDE